MSLFTRQNSEINIDNIRKISFRKLLKKILAEAKRGKFYYASDKIKNEYTIKKLKSMGFSVDEYLSSNYTWIYW